MKRHVSLDLLHRLVDMPIEHSHRTEFLQIRKCLRAIVCSPAPLRIDRPEWNVRKHNYWGAVLQVFYIVFQPLKLVVAQRSESACLQIHHIDQPDEVHTVLFEAVPSRALATFSVPL